MPTITEQNIVEQKKAKYSIVVVLFCLSFEPAECLFDVEPFVVCTFPIASFISNKDFYVFIDFDRRPDSLFLIRSCFGFDLLCECDVS